MLLGEYHHSLDAKNRVSIPAKFRDELGEKFIIVRNIRKSCLCVYSAEEWAKYVEKCKQMPVKVVEKAFEFYYHGAINGTPDSLGRVLMSAALLEHAKISVTPDEGNRSMVFVGCGDYGEIWSEDNYSRHMAELDIDALRQALEEFGL